MTQRRKNQLFLSVLGIGGAALLVDRFFVGSPLAAPAALQAGESASETPPLPGSPAAPATRIAATADGAGLALSIPELPFPRELPRLPEGTRLRDVFSRPKSGPRRSDADGETHDGQLDEEPRDRVKDFPQRHRLDGVFLDEGLKIAVVDGAWVAIGDKVDGCDLASIDGNQATFRCGDRETSLRMEPAPTVDSR